MEAVTSEICAPVAERLNRLKDYFQKGETIPIHVRIRYLKKLLKEIKVRENEILNALKQDLGKAPFEAYATEIGLVRDEIKFTTKNLRTWASNRFIDTPLALFRSNSWIRHEPYGMVAIISPWNYPFQLVFQPLVGAIAAGNVAVIKPSEFTPNTTEISEVIIRNVFPPEYVCLIQGEREATQEIIAQKPDYLLFTGSTKVGKIIAQQCAEHLIPVTLELGGKSPCIVGRSANIDVAANRIVWGKFTNAGQTCIAPDYVVVEHSRFDDLITALKRAIIRFYGDDPEGSLDYGRIINDFHYKRLTECFQEGKITHGGRTNARFRYIEPTIMTHVSPSGRLMNDEIFGPILPIIAFKNREDAVRLIRSKPKPLAMYLFTSDSKAMEYFLREIPSGGVCINDTLVHLATPHLPFGGIGASGMGRYHGKFSFETFSQQRSVMRRYQFPEMNFRYPPFRNKLALLKRLMG